MTISEFRQYVKKWGKGQDPIKLLFPLEQLEYAQRNFSDPTNGKIDQALKDAADMVEIENIPAEEALRIAKETAQKALDQYWASK